MKRIMAILALACVVVGLVQLVIGWNSEEILIDEQHNVICGVRGYDDIHCWNSDTRAPASARHLHHAR